MVQGSIHGTTTVCVCFPPNSGPGSFICNSPSTDRTGLGLDWTRLDWKHGVFATGSVLLQAPLQPGPAAIHCVWKPAPLSPCQSTGCSANPLMHKLPLQTPVQPPSPALPKALHPERKPEWGIMWDAAAVEQRERHYTKGHHPASRNSGDCKT